MYYSEEEPLFNLGYYKNPEFDKLVDEGDVLTGTDREAATEKFVEAQKILVDDAVSVFFYDSANIHVASASVDCYVDNPAYPHVVFVYDLTRK
jgi:peptide/nickel transport system substrate-binding protein